MRRREFITLALGATLGSFAAAVASAQAGAKPLIVFLHGSAFVGQYPDYIAKFLAGLKEEGFELDRDVAVEYRWAEGRYERVPQLAAELLALKPALAIVYGPPGLVRSALDAFPPTLPVVFGTGGDPVAAGVVSSLSRPNGNATGIANRTNSLDVKRIELLRDLLPQVTTIGLILNPNNSDAAMVAEAAQRGAASLERRLVLAHARTPEELEKAFAAIVQQGAGAMLMGSDTFLNAQRDHAVALAGQHRLPVIYSSREFVEVGGLMSYGASFPATYRQVGIYVGKILRGAKPAELPVLEPTQFELVVNLQTARTLGLTVPQSILAHADQVIE